jgi:hypothetical protein
MPQSTQQTRANHVRLHPLFHFFVAPVLLVLVAWNIVHVIRRPGTVAVVLLLVVSVLLVLAYLVRSYALKVQDRVIRLEEKLRLTSLLPERLQPRIKELTESQLIALRFASDEELPPLFEKTLNERLTSRQIKEAIVQWRPDNFRV